MISGAESDGIISLYDIRGYMRREVQHGRCFQSAGGGRALRRFLPRHPYVTELGGLTEIHEVRSEFFSKPYPVSTLVQVAGRVHSDLLIEMSAVAVIPRHRFRRPA